MSARKTLLSIISFFIIITFVFSANEVQAAPGEKYKRTIENYVIPDVTLVDQNGTKVKLRSLLNSKKVVMIDFIYTTCTTICPVLSAGFSNFQKKIGTDAGNAHLVSISIDPENDTPKKMKAYLQRYKATPGWDFLTGNPNDIKKVLASLNASTSDNKMYHLPLAILHSSSANQWVRIYGLIGTSDLMNEYRKVLGQ
ncbi:MAG: SCO family protein [Thermodesulfovibrionales bacterium]